MARDDIDRLASELYGSMRGDVLAKGLEGRRPADRIGVFQDLLVKAVKKSTLCCFNGRPHYFNGCIYVQLGVDSWDAFYSLVLRVADRCGMEPGDKTKLEGVMRTVRREVGLKVLEPDNSIIVLRNGVLDLDGHGFHKFNKRFMQVTQMDFDYIPEEVPNVWTDCFLDEVLDRECQRVLQEFMGAIFIDRSKVSVQKMLILWGPGRNGKSVIQSTLIGLLGEENVKTIAIADLLGGSERKQNMASVNGKRLNYCSEMQENEFRSNPGALKALISGEPFEVRQVYINNFTARNIPLMMANTNHLPRMRDVSHGLADRLIVLPFETIIEEHRQNKRLAEQLRREYPAILNWILQGRRRFIDNGYRFSITERLREIVEEKVAESSSVLAFMKAKGYGRSLADIDTGVRWLRAGPLYHAYVAWCAGEELAPDSLTKFGTVLAEAGYARRRISNCRVYGVYPANPRPIKEEYKGANDNDLVEGMSNLAHWFGVSRQVIEKMMNARLLEGCYRMEGRRYWFIREKCRKPIRRFLRTDLRRDDGRVPADLKADRRAFNTAMRNSGLPFRKAEDYNPHAAGIIYVTDEFNYQLDRDDFVKYLKFDDRIDYSGEIARLRGNLPEVPEEGYMDDEYESDNESEDGREYGEENEYGD